MHFNQIMVSFDGFAILLKILSAHCVHQNVTATRNPVWKKGCLNQNILWGNIFHVKNFKGLIKLLFTISIQVVLLATRYLIQHLLRNC